VTLCSPRLRLKIPEEISVVTVAFDNYLCGPSVKQNDRRDWSVRYSRIRESPGSHIISSNPLKKNTLVSDPRPLEGREQHRKCQLLRPEPSQRFLDPPTHTLKKGGKRFRVHGYVPVSMRTGGVNTCGTQLISQGHQHNIKLSRWTHV